MGAVAAFIYWVIVLVWCAVVVTVVRVYPRYKLSFPAFSLLLMVIFVDGMRNIAENTYFGLYFGSIYGVLPQVFRDVLGLPQFLIVTKLMNIVAASFVLWLLVLRCLPGISREQATARNALAREMEEHGRLLETSPDLIVVTDRDRVIRRISQSCSTILGYEPQDLVGRYGGEFIHPDDLLRIRDIIGHSALSGQAQNFNATFVHRDGHGVPLAFSGVWSPIAERFFLIGRDISEAMAAEEKLRDLALVDQLTRLPNRNTLIADLERRIAEHGAFALVMFDLDGFKEINDALGHAAGDKVLQLIAELAVEAAPGATVYRLGGDEFVMLFHQIADPLLVSAAVRRLAARCDRGIDVDGRLVFLGISAGICSSGQADSDMDELIYCADLALYRAKANGGHKVVLFEPTMRSAARGRQELETELRNAVAQGQFELFYQPQIRLADDALVGAEALLRWRHPVKGIVAPGAFIEVLNRSPMASAVGEWILERACSDVAQWNVGSGLSIRVGVNLFPSQYNDRDLIRTVQAALASSGLEPNCLELEVTENIALERYERAPGLMRDLRALGIGLAFDDFGTGYASLSHLMRYPLTRLKIDRSFIRNITSGSEGGERPIVRAMIAMAHGLNLKVVAEGVETAEQAALLRSKGCDEVQGFFYGRPMPAQEFSAWAAAWKLRQMQGQGAPEQRAAS